MEETDQLPHEIPLLNTNYFDKSEDSIKYFTCLNKSRILPKKSEVGGIVLTLVLIIVPTITFLTFTLLFGIIYGSQTILIVSIIGAILSLITFIMALVLLWDVSTRIPGYQEGPKMTFKEFKEKSLVKTVKNVVFFLKYCDTCGIVRDIRTFHCKICNMCIIRHDHHCGFVANCIGKNNIKSFYLFIIVILIHCLEISGFSLYFLITFLSVSNHQLNDHLIYPFIINAGMGLIFTFLVGTMFAELTCSISKNKTTNENIRNKYDNSVFDNGCRNNWKILMNSN